MNNFRTIALYFIIILGLLSLSAQVFYYSDYIHFLETYFSPDNHISDPLIKIVDIDILLIVSALLTIWIDWNDFKFSNVNVIDKISIASISTIIILYLSKKQSDFLSLMFSEDHFFENLTVVLALLTSILLAFNLKRFHDRYSRSFLILSSLAFFYLGMEEISWGQDIFKWNTPKLIGELNYQNETNTHNFLNPYFSAIYISFNILITSILLFSKQLKRILARYLNESFKYLIPDNAYLYYAIIFSFLIVQSYYTYGGELTEEVFSIFSFSYATNLSQKKIVAKY